MTNEAEIEDKFWKALKSDMTMMLGLSGVDDEHSQPMTAQLDEDRPHGPIWFFTSKDVDLVKALGTGHRAFASFASKGHDLFASLQGELVLDNDRATIDRNDLVSGQRAFSRTYNSTGWPGPRAFWWRLTMFRPST